MKKKNKKLTISRETITKMDKALESVAGGCYDGSACPECPPLSRVYTACICGTEIA